MVRLDGLNTCGIETNKSQMNSIMCIHSTSALTTLGQQYIIWPISLTSFSVCHSFVGFDYIFLLRDYLESLL